MSYQGSIAKNSALFYGAGESDDNPILAGLPIKFGAEFSEDVAGVVGYFGQTTPPTTAAVLSQSQSNSRRYEKTGVAGVTPFDTVDAKTYARIVATSSLTGDQTKIEKEFYIASLPTDAIQVYGGSGWQSVNFATHPGAVPLCSQMCPVRFFGSWYDNFRIPGYGGVRYVSIYDYGTAEDDEERADVYRAIDQAIEDVRYMYLQKHANSTIETHDIAIKFKVGTGASAAGVTVRVKVQSQSCWGFEVKDPVTS